MGGHDAGRRGLGESELESEHESESELESKPKPKLESEPKPERLRQRRREHRHHVPGAPGGRLVYADPHADTRPDVAVTIPVPFFQFFRLRHADRSNVVRHGPDWHAEQDAGIAIALRLGFGLVGIEFGHRLTVPIGLLHSVRIVFVVRDLTVAQDLVVAPDLTVAQDLVVAPALVVAPDLVVGHRLRLPRRVHRLEPHQHREPCQQQPQQQREPQQQSDEHGGPARTLRERPALAGQHQPRPEGDLRSAGLDRE